MLLPRSLLLRTALVLSACEFRGAATLAVSALCVVALEGTVEAKATFTTFDVASVQSINVANTVTGVYDSGVGASSFVRTFDGTITTFAVPNANFTQAMSINDDSAVAGFYDDNDSAGHGFVRGVDGTITKFDVPGASDTFPYSINSKGKIAGYYTDSTGDHHGFLRAAGGNITTFDVSNAHDTDPRSINRKGEIVGYYGDNSGYIHGFIRAANGDITTFDVSGEQLPRPSPSMLKVSSPDGISAMTIRTALFGHRTGP